MFSCQRWVLGDMYRWLSVIAKLVAIVGFAGLTLLYWIILLGSEEASSVVPWLLLISVFIAGPATIFSLLLSFLKEKIGYNLSFIFAVPLLVSAIWIVSYSIRDLLFALDARGIDALKIGVNTGFALLIFSPCCSAIRQLYFKKF